MKGNNIFLITRALGEILLNFQNFEEINFFLDNLSKYNYNE